MMGKSVWHLTHTGSSRTRTSCIPRGSTVDSPGCCCQVVTSCRSGQHHCPAADAAAARSGLTSLVRPARSHLGSRPLLLQVCSDSAHSARSGRAGAGWLHRLQDEVAQQQVPAQLHLLLACVLVRVCAGHARRPPFHHLQPPHRGVSAFQAVVREVEWPGCAACVAYRNLGHACTGEVQMGAIRLVSMYSLEWPGDDKSIDSPHTRCACALVYGSRASATHKAAALLSFAGSAWLSPCQHAVHAEL